jgi:hypothetical protein
MYLLSLGSEGATRTKEVLARQAALRPYSEVPELRPVALRPTLSDGLPLTGSRFNCDAIYRSNSHASVDILTFSHFSRIHETRRRMLRGQSRHV